jgi:hypothetical protein
MSGMGKPARIILLFVGWSALAHEPITTKLTWTKEISRVLYRHCVSCHRPGGAAFSLLTYEETRPWAKGIRDEVLNRRMPPWDAVKGVGEFRDDASLSLTEIDLVVNWVEGGVPVGDSSYVPSFPVTADEVKPAAPVRGVEIRGTSTLGTSRLLRGIRPAAAAEVAALLPDGSVRRLLWVRNFRAEWNRIYWLRTPERLPRGTRLTVSGSAVEVFW